MKKNTFKRDEILKFCREHARKAPIGECMNLADQFQKLDNEEYRLGCIIAILSSYFCNDHGELIPEKMPVEMTPVLEIAFKEIQYRHAWVSCGPVSNGMERLLKEMEETYKKKEN